MNIHMFESRFDLNSPIANTKLAVSKIIGPEGQQQQIQIPIRKTKLTRNFGVNTSRAITTENSFDMIKPITHSVFPTIGRVSRKQLILGDGLDEQYSVPAKKVTSSKFYRSEPKQIKAQQHRYNNNFNLNKQKIEQLKNTLNPQMRIAQRQEQGCNKIRNIVNLNLKNIEASLNQIRKSRTIYYKKRFQKQKQINQEEPIAKKSCKVSNASTKIVETNNINRQTKNTQQNILKQSIKSEIQPTPLQQIQRTEKKDQNIPTHQRPKLEDIDYPQQVNLEQTIGQQIDYSKKKQHICTFKQGGQLIIDLKTSISTLKRALIQGEDQLKIDFQMPQALFNPPNQNSSNEQLKARMWEIFKHAGHQPLIITIKRYQDRVELRCKNFCAIWSYDGKAYIGGWTGQKTLAELNKHGVGVQWSGKDEHSPYIYYGQFKDNKKEGYGLLKKQNNEVYVGCWKNNKKQGWGRVYGPDCKLKVNGQFTQNELLCSEQKI